MKIKYTDKNGKTHEIEMSKDQENVEIEVGKEFFESVHEIVENARRLNRVEKFRQSSLERMDDEGRRKILADHDADPILHVVKKEKNETLHRALDGLLPQQRELVRRVFFEGVSMAQIAREQGVSAQAIQDRMTKIYEQIKKHLLTF